MDLTINPLDAVEYFLMVRLLIVIVVVVIFLGAIGIIAYKDRKIQN